MFDIGWTELLLIGIVALIVIGPQDLPDMFRQIGRFTAKLRSMSRDFTRAMEQAAKESGIKDIAKDVNAMASPSSLGLNAVKEAADRFEKWDPLKPVTAAAQKPLTPPPMPPTPSSAAAQAAAQAAAPAAAVSNPSLAPVGGLAATPSPEELADIEPELPRRHGPETRALYEKKARAEAERAARRATGPDAADASPARSAPARKAAAKPASSVPAAAAAPKPASRARKPAAAAPAPDPSGAAPAPRAPRRRKGDTA